MQLNSLKAKAPRRQSIVVGRGGKRGKTSGRGGKGQTARAGHKIRPEARDMIKKIPKRRGYGKNRAKGVRAERVVYAPVNLASLEHFFPAGAIITPAAIIEKGIVRVEHGRRPKMKILGTGELSKAFALKNVVVSASAKAAIEKAGGSISDSTGSR
jgi:large subunit ribosomal protein L15